MIAQVLVEGLILGILLMGVCAFGIRNGAVGMVHLYHQDVKERCVELGLTTYEKIKWRTGLLVWFLADVCHFICNESDGSFSG